MLSRCSWATRLPKCGLASLSLSLCLRVRAPGWLRSRLQDANPRLVLHSAIAFCALSLEIGLGTAKGRTSTATSPARARVVWCGVCVHGCVCICIRRCCLADSIEIEGTPKLPLPVPPRDELQGWIMCDVAWRALLLSSSPPLLLSSSPPLLLPTLLRHTSSDFERSLSTAPHSPHARGCLNY